MSVSTVIIVGCGKQNVPMKKHTQVPGSCERVTIHGRKDVAKYNEGNGSQDSVGAVLVTGSQRFQV